MSFPTSPVNGQTATVNNVTFQYNATYGTWTRVTGLVSNLSVATLTTTTGAFYANGFPLAPSYTSSTTAPASANARDQWYNPSTDVLYEYVFDGVSGYWVDYSSEGAGYTTTTASITTSVIPASANTLTLGSATYPFANLYIANIVPAGNTITVTGNIVPSANITYNIGSPTQRFQSLYLSGNTIDLAGAVIKSDPVTGAIALIPTPSASNPNPTGIVVSPSGSISTVATTGGNLNANSISNASNSIVATGSVVGNLTASGNAVIQAINLAGNNNLFTQSNLALWQYGGNTTIAATGAIAPDGTPTAATFTTVGAGGSEYIYWSVGSVINTTYTISVYVKPVNFTGFYIQAFQQGGLVGFSLVGAGSITYAPTGTFSNPNIVAVSNGWYRCSTNFTATATASGNFGFATNQNNLTQTDYYIWGPQFEPGIVASPYTPTTGSAITTYNNLYIPQGNIIGSPTVTGNLTVGGNLQVVGNVTTINYETILYTETANVLAVTGNIYANTVVSNGNANVTLTANTGIIDASHNTGALIFPIGSTAQRPSSPVAGMTRYNTNNGSLEWYDAASSTWLNVYQTPTYTVSYLIVAGGGSGGNDGAGAGDPGGGGAGGLVAGTTSLTTGSTYTVTVGAGGAGVTGTGTGINGQPGSNSSITGLTTAIGGGYGGGAGGNAGGAGGSGGGGNNTSSGGAGTSGQGNNGGAGNSGGGGGAGGVGGAGPAGAGGVGLTESIITTSIATTYSVGQVSSGSVYFAGGGGGWGSGAGGVGGLGGGGTGYFSGLNNATAGSPNTGGGGGANHGANGDASVGGGSGVVIISYASPSQRATGGTVTSYSNAGTTYWVHIYTTSGSYIA
jgi:hypothetical protein